MSWVLLASALVAGLGLFWLLRAFATGRAVGVYGTADRASNPGLFWLHVAVLLGLVAVSSTHLAWVATTRGMGWRSFQALHPVAHAVDAPASPVARTSAFGCNEPGPRVCFVTVGAPPDIPVDKLARYYSTLLGLPVGALDPIALTKQAGGVPVIDERRSQLGIAALTSLVRDTYPMLWTDRDATVVIVTGNDLWAENHPEWRYVFGSAVSRRSGGGFAVVSSARMDPAAYGQAADAARLERRVHALVGKYLAILRYGEKPSDDSSSPVYNSVRSPSDLDRMRTFSPPR